MLTIKIAKLNTTHDFDPTTLPVASAQYALTYGLTQAVNDAHASVMRKNFTTDAEYIAAVEVKVKKRIDQIESGNVPGSRAPVDQAAAVRRKLIKDMEAAGIDLATVTKSVLVDFIKSQTATAGNGATV